MVTIVLQKESILHTLACHNLLNELRQGLLPIESLMYKCIKRKFPYSHSLPTSQPGISGKYSDLYLKHGALKLEGGPALNQKL